MNIVAALTLAFAGIGAAGTVHSIADGMLRRRAERRRELEAVEANWTLHAKSGWFEEHTALSLTCNDVGASPVRLISIQVLEPEGAQLCEGQPVQGEGPPIVTPLDDRWTARLNIDRDLYGTVVWGEGQERSVQWVVTHLLARMPVEPATRRGRYRLAVVVEERSAARRRRRITVASQEVDWPGTDQTAPA